MFRTCTFAAGHGMQRRVKTVLDLKHTLLWIRMLRAEAALRGDLEVYSKETL
jgi:hypothetical protein